MCNFMRLFLCALIAVICALPAYAQDDGGADGEVIEAIPISARASYVGKLEYQEGFSFCMQGRFWLRDCADNIIIRVTEREDGPDLDALVGQFVEISGDDVGVECPVVAAETVLVSNDACTDPINNRTFFEGVLVINDGPSICMQGRHALQDCNGNLVIRLQENTNGPDLDSLVGQYVRLRGESVGVECPIVAPTEVSVLESACAGPSPDALAPNPREGMLVLNESRGGFELRDCAGNVKTRLSVNSSRLNLSAFTGQYVRVRGKLKRQKGIIEVRQIIVKPTRCSSQP